MKNRKVRRVKIEGLTVRDVADICELQGRPLPETVAKMIQ